MADHTSSFSASRRRAWASSRSPAGASASLRPWRSNRRQSSASSSRLICWLAAAWLTPSTEAAAVTPSASTTARKARIREMSRSLRIRVRERLYPKHSFLLSGEYSYRQGDGGKDDYRPLAAHRDAVQGWRRRLQELRAADRALPGAGHRRAVPARDHGRIADPRRSRDRRARRAHRGDGGGPRAGVRGRGRQRHRQGREGLEAAGAPCLRRHRLGLPLLQPPEPGRPDRAFPRHRRGDRPRRADLQHPLSHGREPRQRLAARTCRGEEHRRRQGQLGQHRPIARAADAQAQGTSRC